MGGPMIMQQQQQVPSKQKCRYVETSLNVDIERGMFHGDTIIFKGFGEHQPKKIPGDVKLKLSERKHKLFRRKGSDLHVDIDISLKEALLGFERTFVHLDGRSITVQVKEVMAPNG